MLHYEYQIYLEKIFDIFVARKNAELKNHEETNNVWFTRFEVEYFRIRSGDSGGGITEIVGSGGEIWRLLSDVGSRAGEWLMNDLRMRGEVRRHRSTHSGIGCHGRSQVAVFVYLWEVLIRCSKLHVYESVGGSYFRESAATDSLL